MSEETVTIHPDEATKEQIRYFARVSLSMAVPTNISLENLLSRMRQTGWDGKEIIAPPAPESGSPIAPPETPASTHEPAEASPGIRQIGWTQIIIPSTETAGGTQPVHIGVNGVNVYVERDTNSWVKDHYIEALQHAIEQRLEQRPRSGDDPGTDFVPRNVPRHPVSILQRAMFPIGFNPNQHDDATVRANASPNTNMMAA